MIDCSSIGRSRRMKAHVKMLFSCFGSKAQAVTTTTTTTTTSSTERRPRETTDRRRGANRKTEERDPHHHHHHHHQSRRKKRKVVVVGDGECGKTCLMQRFCRDTYNQQGYLPTVFDTEVVDVELHKTTVELMITDTAGQEDYDRLRPYSYPDSDVVIICFAIDNPDSLENVRLNWMPEVRYFCGNVPVLLVGNKMDLRGQGEAEILQSTASSEDFLVFPECCPSATLIKQGPVKMSSGKKLAADLGAEGYWETSALLDQGVAEVFQAASRAALRPRTQSVKKFRNKQGCRRKRSFLERFGIKKSRQG